MNPGDPVSYPNPAPAPNCTVKIWNRNRRQQGWPKQGFCLSVHHSEEQNKNKPAPWEARGMPWQDPLWSLARRSPGFCFFWLYEKSILVSVHVCVRLWVCMCVSGTYDHVYPYSDSNYKLRHEGGFCALLWLAVFQCICVCVHEECFKENGCKRHWKNSWHDPDIHVASY